MKNRSLLYSVFLLVAAWGFEKVQAQDTTRRQPRTVEVTSTFKPVLKDAAKINFNATPPVADTVAAAPEIRCAQSKPAVCLPARLVKAAGAFH
jgi:hypothetical protein